MGFSLMGLAGQLFQVQGTIEKAVASSASSEAQSRVHLIGIGLLCNEFARVTGGDETRSISTGRIISINVLSNDLRLLRLWIVLVIVPKELDTRN
jgi:hypothetical protein